MTIERDAVVAPIRRAHPARRPGKVWLVGAGPGDADLLTVKAARLLSNARVVLYDHLVGEGVLALLPANARLICVGKRSHNHSLPQEEINALLVRLAGEGGEVVRLKGGDPYVFGRGAEEALALSEAGIAFEVVPGITSAQGMASYAGIPLTHRGVATSVVYVTGHCRDGGEEPDWSALARPHQTVVIYMGLARLDTICRQLVAHGLPATTPAALVEQATTPRQRVVEGALGGLPALAAQHRVTAPALIVVGDVVRLHAELGWFSPPPPAWAWTPPQQAQLA